MVETKMVVHSVNVVKELLVKSRVVFKTKGPFPTTVVTVDSLDHASILRIAGYKEIFVTIEDADQQSKCTCIAKELTDPKCPDHGE